MKIVYDGNISKGCSPVEGEPIFFAHDFPLPRKESTWRLFPSRISQKLDQTRTYEPHYRNPCLPKPRSRSDFPNFLEWDAKVRSLQQDSNTKVVLCRKTTFTFDELIDPYLVIDLLLQKSVNAKVFGIITSPHHAFACATPELLLRRNNRNLSIEALAGTKPLRFETELLSSEKDLREFAFVKETIRQKLGAIALPFDTSQEIFIKKTSKVCHLHYPFHVTLKEDMSDSALLELLHPTPAISGYPSDHALLKIASLEPFDRGLYSGAIGISSTESSEIYVGIRSALIEENKIHLFAGAGIVQGSRPDLEWQELEYKISQFEIT